MKDLENKKIIVTGASGGIGNSIVEKLSEKGATILASGTRVEKLEELKSKFSKIKVLKFDISQNDKIEEFIENATKEFTIDDQIKMFIRIFHITYIPDFPFHHRSFTFVSMFHILDAIPGYINIIYILIAFIIHLFGQD